MELLWLDIARLHVDADLLIWIMIPSTLITQAFKGSVHCVAVVARGCRLGFQGFVSLTDRADRRELMLGLTGCIGDMRKLHVCSAVQFGPDGFCA